MWNVINTIFSLIFGRWFRSEHGRIWRKDSFAVLNSLEVFLRWHLRRGLMKWGCWINTRRKVISVVARCLNHYEVVKHSLILLLMTCWDGSPWLGLYFNLLLWLFNRSYFIINRMWAEPHLCRYILVHRNLLQETLLRRTILILYVKRALSRSLVII